MSEQSGLQAKLHSNSERDPLEVAAPDRDDFVLTLLGPGYGEWAIL